MLLAFEAFFKKVLAVLKPIAVSDLPPVPGKVCLKNHAGATFKHNLSVLKDKLQY